MLALSGANREYFDSGGLAFQFQFALLSVGVVRSNSVIGGGVHVGSGWYLRVR
jgi:hypothetical protein